MNMQYKIIRKTKRNDFFIFIVLQQKGMTYLLAMFFIGHFLVKAFLLEV